MITNLTPAMSATISGPVRTDRASAKRVVRGGSKPVSFKA